ncbi:MAG: glycosyltransferase [Burkholderiales bacterium]|nr:glycosyltransferase [Burkholderiales bacterium]
MSPAARPGRGADGGPLKIVQVVASINRDVGGPATTVPMLAVNLQRLGVACTLASIDDRQLGPPLALEGLRYAGVPADFMARRLRGWSPAFARALGELVAAGAHAVHNHGLWMFPNFHARRAAERAGVPLVISPRGMLDPWSLGRGVLKKGIAWHAFERRNLQAATAFHATSEAEAAAIRALGFRQPIAVIPNGVEIPAGTRAPRSLLEARFLRLRGRRWLLFLSRLHPKKGVEELLRAWRRLEAAHGDWQLVVAGPDLDGYGESVRRLSRQLGLEERTTFTGPLAGDARACALANAELLALPTHSENFGIVVAEALAHGTPVVTTRAAPWGALQEHGCGWWIDDSEPALAAALDEAMSLAPAPLEAMGARGRKLVEARFSWDHVAREMKSAYEWLVGSGPRPACVREQ